MHFDAATETTGGLLLGDWFKSVITGSGLRARRKTVCDRAPGRIRVIVNGQLLPAPVATLQVAATGEAGLMELANRISRLTVQGNQAGGEVVVLERIPQQTKGTRNHTDSWCPMSVVVGLVATSRRRGCAVSLLSRSRPPARPRASGSGLRPPGFP
jgi:hypothetical protein